MSKILNPDTNRYVLRDGKIGRNILEKSPRSKSPKKRKSSKKSPKKRKSSKKRKSPKFSPKKSPEVSPKLLSELNVNNVKLRPEDKVEHDEDDSYSPKELDTYYKYTQEQMDIYYNFLHPKDKIIGFEIISLGFRSPEKIYNNEKGKKQIDDIYHAVLRFKFTDNSFLNFEWGEISSKLEASKNDLYTHGNWVGFVLLQKKLKKPISGKDIVEHAIKWKIINKGREGSYPRNCRGYVDSFLVSVLGEKPIGKDKIDWILKR